MAVPSGTPLHIPFVFSFMRRGKGAPAAPSEGKKEGEDSGSAAKVEAAAAAGGVVHPYENSIKTITQVSTVEEFWQTYDFLKRPNDLPTTTDYHFFRSGIKPTWEDVSPESQLCAWACYFRCLRLFASFGLNRTFML